MFAIEKYLFIQYIGINKKIYTYYIWKENLNSDGHQFYQYQQ